MLALHGGPKAITHPLTQYNSIGDEEINAAVEVLRSGKLSGFIARDNEYFLGGPYVLKLEELISQFVGVKHAISVNSWTSGLICAIGALDTEPGDEIITSPWTMSATASAILHLNCIPVFADINPLTYNIDPFCVEKLITSRTKAVLAVDIFGLSCDIPALMKICAKHGIPLITDSAQAPLSTVHDSYAGTLADIGGYSFNSHKHIQTGEGGILLTNDDKFARRMQLLRNHAETCLRPEDSLSNMVGYNFRLGEIEAAIAYQQFLKLPAIIESRQQLAKQLTSSLSSLHGLILPHIPEGYSHVYYVYPLQLKLDQLSADRDYIVRALLAEGVPVSPGYTNIHLLPLYQNQQAYGSAHFPWCLNPHTFNYSIGSLPVAEALHSRSFVGLGLCNHELTSELISQFAEAFHKVWKSL